MSGFCFPGFTDEFAQEVFTKFYVCLYLCLPLCVLCWGSPLECEICPLLRSEPFEMKMPACAVTLLKETVCVFACVCALGCTVWIRVQILLVAQSAKTLLCTGCGPHGIQLTVQSSTTQFYFTAHFLSPLLTSPVFCFISMFQGSSKHNVYSTQHSGRHLLDFSSEAETEVVMGPDSLNSGPSEVVDR